MIPLVSHDTTRLGPAAACRASPPLGSPRAARSFPGRARAVLEPMAATTSLPSGDEASSRRARTLGSFDTSPPESSGDGVSKRPFPGGVPPRVRRPKAAGKGPRSPVGSEARRTGAPAVRRHAVPNAGAAAPAGCRDGCQPGGLAGAYGFSFSRAIVVSAELRLPLPLACPGLPGAGCRLPNPRQPPAVAPTRRLPATARDSIQIAIVVSAVLGCQNGAARPARHYDPRAFQALSKGWVTVGVWVSGWVGGWLGRWGVEGGATGPSRATPTATQAQAVGTGSSQVRVLSAWVAQDP